MDALLTQQHTVFGMNGTYGVRDSHDNPLTRFKRQLSLSWNRYGKSEHWFCLFFTDVKWDPAEPYAKNRDSVVVNLGAYYVIVIKADAAILNTVSLRNDDVVR